MTENSKRKKEEGVVFTRSMLALYHQYSIERFNFLFYIFISKDFQMQQVFSFVYFVVAPPPSHAFS